MKQRFALSVLSVVIACGCGPSRPARVVPPNLDADAVIDSIMSLADSDRDGAVGRTEAKSLPALTSAFEDFDEDRDGRISTAELRRWLDVVKDSRVAITSVAGEVRHLGRSLANATVRLVPEPFMGRGMRAAGGVTDEHGRFAAKIDGGMFPGVNCGIYRVEITGDGNDGKPLSSTYNAQSSLGLAVGGRLPPNGWVVFELK